MNEHAQASQARSIDRLQPDDLLRTFSRTHMVRNLAIAGVLHLLVIGLASWPMVYGWVDPAWKAQRDAAAAEPAPAPAPAPAAAPPAPRVAPEQASPATGSADDAGASAAEPARELTPVEQRVQEAADPEDIPALPTLDIDFRDVE